MGSAVGELLPLAVGIAISPVPIIAVILMLFSPKARSNGPAFLLGWMLGLVVAGGVILALTGTQDLGAETEPSFLASLIKLILGILLLFLAYRNWQKRPQEGETPEMPKWMDSIDAFSPIKALGLAAILSGVNPKNLALNAAAMTNLAQAGLSDGDTIIALLVFVLLCSLSVAIPVLYYLFGGEGAKQTLDGWKIWLGANNATVMAVLLLVLGAKLFGQGLGSLIPF